MDSNLTHRGGVVARGQPDTGPMAAMPAGVSVTLRPYGKRPCRSCQALRLLNTFFGQSPPAGSGDRGLSGRCLRIVRFTTRRARAGRGPWRRRVRAPVRRGAGLVWREYGRPAEELGGGQGL